MYHIIDLLLHKICISQLVQPIRNVHITFQRRSLACAWLAFNPTQLLYVLKSMSPLRTLYIISAIELFYLPTSILSLSITLLYLLHTSSHWISSFSLEVVVINVWIILLIFCEYYNQSLSSVSFIYCSLLLFPVVEYRQKPESIANMGDFDPCECVWSHEHAMRRLINMVSYYFK